MAGKKHEKNTSEWKMISELWIFFQKYWTPEDNDQYWEQLIGEADAFCKKFWNVPLARFLIRAFLSYAESEYSEIKKKIA